MNNVFTLKSKQKLLNTSLLGAINTDMDSEYYVIQIGDDTFLGYNGEDVPIKAARRFASRNEAKIELSNWGPNSQLEVRKVINQRQFRSGCSINHVESNKEYRVPTIVFTCGRNKPGVCCNGSCE